MEGWFLDHMNTKIPPMKRRRLSKKEQKKGDDIKIKLQEAKYILTIVSSNCIGTILNG